MEVKEAVDQYSELSPLYGFIHYRRRKVILKYLPDGISRLLQGKRGLGNALHPCTNSHLARVAVHFQYVVEKFTPSDTTFAFSISAQLRDSALSKACSRHTASASIKSSCDSLRQIGLEEIAEDAHEAQSGIHDNNGHRAGSVDSIDSDRRRTLLAGDHLQERHSSAMRSPSPSQSVRTIRHHRDKALPKNTPELGPEVRDNRLGVDDSQSEKGRSSFQSSRPPTRDLYSTYEYKPKIKLGPRPSIDSAKRTHRSDSKDGDPRPVCTLPPSIRLPSRKSASTTPRSPPKVSLEKTLPEVPVSSPFPIIPIQLLDPTVVTSVITPAKAIEAKSQDMTPEKRKLMKAVQLRQKQLAARSVKKSSKSESPSPEPVRRHDDKMQAINKPSNPMLDRSIVPDLEDSKEVSIALRDVDDPSRVIADSSPISIQEPSEGPSTKASSMTDEDDLQAREHSDLRMESEHLATKVAALPPKSQDIRTPPTAVIDEDIISPFTQNHTVAIIDFSTPFTGTMSPCEVPLPPISDDELQSLDQIDKLSGRERTSTDVLKPSETVYKSNPDRLHKLALEENSSTIITAGTSSDQVHKHSSEEGSMTPHILKPTWESPSLVIPRALDHDSELNITRPSTGDTMNEPGFDRVPLKHGLPRSIRRISSHENSDDHFLSDDSFMEELGSATMQEAKPIQVSKSPVNPLFPRQSGWEQVARKSRSVSNSADEGSKDYLRPLTPRMPLQSSFRSASASQPTSYEPQQASTIMLKKVGVSSGISQRIKALEKLSSPGAPPASVILRKPSLQRPLAVPEVVKSGPSFPQRMSSLPSVSSPETTPVSMKAKPVSTKAASTSKKPRPESISVTAKIIRDPRNVAPAVRVDPSEPRALDLYESPLVVEHQTAESSAGSSPLKPPRHKLGDSRSASSSDTERQSETTQTARRDSFASRRSTRSRRGSEVDQTRSLSDTSSNGMSGLDGIRLDKKESRKSRLFKRMSTISSASRRSIVYAFNSPVKEPPIDEHHEAPHAFHQALPANTHFGDVNIQFPDTLVSSAKLFLNMDTNVKYSSGNGVIFKSMIKEISSYHLRKESMSV